MARVLVVEGMPSVRESVRMILAGEHEVLLAARPEEAGHVAGPTVPDLVLVGGPAGARRRPADRPTPWAEAVRGLLPPVPLRLRPLPLPFAVADLRGVVRRALAEPPESAPGAAPPAPRQLGWREALVPTGLAAADPTGALLRTASRAAATTLPVLLVGERGTGRETVARWIHAAGPLAAGPLVVLTCPGLAPDALASRLAHAAKGARVTLLLKEVDDASPALQEALLGLAESGAEGPRLLASASEAVWERVEQGLFSEALLEGLGVVTLHLAPLREQPALVGALAGPLLERAARDAGLPHRRLAPVALERLGLYCWPGNLRELAAALARSAALADGETLGPDDVDFGLAAAPQGPTPARAAPDPAAAGSAPADRPGRALPDPAAVGSIPTAPRAPMPAQDAAAFLALAAELAHEIKNPLVAVKTFTQLLGDKFDDPEFRGEFYRVVRRDVERIDHLVEGILQAAAPDGGAPEPIDARALVEDVLGRSEAWMTERRVVPFTDLGADASVLLAVRAQAHAALFNVVARALASLPAGGDLFVTTRADGDEVDIAVTYHDTSSGGAVGEELEIALARLALDRAGGRLHVAREPDRRTTVGLSFRSAHAPVPAVPRVPDRSAVGSAGAASHTRLRAI